MTFTSLFSSHFPSASSAANAFAHDPIPVLRSSAMREVMNSQSSSPKSMLKLSSPSI